MTTQTQMTPAEALDWLHGLAFSVRTILLESADRVEAWRLERVELEKEGARAFPREPDPTQQPWADDLQLARDASTAIGRETPGIVAGLSGIGNRIPSGIDPDGAAWEMRLKMRLGQLAQAVAVAQAFMPRRRGYTPGRFPARCTQLADSLTPHLKALAEFRDLLAVLPPMIPAGPGAKPPVLSAGIALTPDHESILAVLGKTQKKCKTVIDVASTGKIRNRETVGRLLSELAGFGMVHRPHGKRKGYALTDAGAKRLHEESTDITPAQLPT